MWLNAGHDKPQMMQVVSLNHKTPKPYVDQTPQTVVEINRATNQQKAKMRLPMWLSNRQHRGFSIRNSGTLHSDFYFGFSHQISVQCVRACVCAVLEVGSGRVWSLSI
jgi:hypothetical protein